MSPHTELSDWLIVESYSNWSKDHQRGFSYFGILNRFAKRLAVEMKTGHRLFTYVTGRSAFADIRIITRDGIRRAPLGDHYDDFVPYLVDTKPDTILPPDKWVSVKELKESLQITAGKIHWSHQFRVSPQWLDPRDAALLEKEIKSAAAS